MGLELRLQLFLHFFRTGEHQNAGGFFIQPMYDENLVHRFLRFDISGKISVNRFFFFFLRRNREQVGFFVDDEQVIILMENIKFCRQARDKAFFADFNAVAGLQQGFANARDHAVDANAIVFQQLFECVLRRSGIKHAEMLCE